MDNEPTKIRYIVQERPYYIPSIRMLTQDEAKALRETCNSVKVDTHWYLNMLFTAAMSELPSRYDLDNFHDYIATQCGKHENRIRPRDVYLRTVLTERQAEYAREKLLELNKTCGLRTILLRATPPYDRRRRPNT